MSLLFSVVGFAAQFCVVCVSIALFIDMHSVVSAEHDVLVSAASLPQLDVVNNVDESDATLPCASSHCAKSMMPSSYTTTIDELATFTYDYSAMTVRELKALCKSQGFRGYSSLRKYELVELLSEF